MKKTALAVAALALVAMMYFPAQAQVKQDNKLPAKLETTISAKLEAVSREDVRKGIEGMIAIDKTTVIIEEAKQGNAESTVAAIAILENLVEQAKEDEALREGFRKALQDVGTKRAITEEAIVKETSSACEENNSQGIIKFPGSAKIIKELKEKLGDAWNELSPKEQEHLVIEQLFKNLEKKLDKRRKPHTLPYNPKQKLQLL